MLDLPDGHGKSPIGPNYLTETNDEGFLRSAIIRADHIFTRLRKAQEPTPAIAPRRANRASESYNSLRCAKSAKGEAPTFRGATLVRYFACIIVLIGLLGAAPTWAQTPQAPAAAPAKGQPTQAPAVKASPAPADKAADPMSAGALSPALVVATAALDKAGAAIKDIETSLERPNVSDGELAALRQQTDQSRSR